MPSASSSPDPSVGEQFGPYEIEAFLGEGGMGRVFRTRRGDGASVALKLLKRALVEEQHGRRFEREVRAAREVSHRHLVEVLDAGVVGGRRYLAMTYVAGRSLADRVREQGPLPIADGVRIVGEVASGLDALHAAGIVHRDVKPSNILLDDERGAQLTDFGLAKRSDYSTLTRPGQLLGTLDYLAPEVLQGAELAPAADRYALGCVAFECFAGQPPFAGRGMMATGLAHLQDEPADPLAGRGEAPDGLGDVVRLALLKEPDRRPPTAVAYAQLLLVAARSV